MLKISNTVTLDENEVEIFVIRAQGSGGQKLIDGVLQNTTEMYGSLKGIAGSGVLGHIEALELPERLDSDE